MQLICSEFDEFEEALYGVQGRYVLRTRQQRDWQLNVVDLNGVALMSGREGAGTVVHRHWAARLLQHLPAAYGA